MFVESSGQDKLLITQLYDETKKARDYYMFFFSLKANVFISILKVCIDGIEAQHRGLRYNGLTYKIFYKFRARSLNIFCSVPAEPYFSLGAWLHISMPRAHGHQLFQAL